MQLKKFGKIKFPYKFPVPLMNKGTLNSQKITEHYQEISAEQNILQVPGPCTAVIFDKERLKFT